MALALCGADAPYGAVLVSTGMRKQDKRVAAPSRLKMGNYKLKNNDNVVLAAA